MNEFFIQIEVQENASGVRGVIPLVFDDYNQALAKHYTVLSVAATGDLPYHASFVIASNGVVMQQMVFDRRTAPTE